MSTLLFYNPYHHVSPSTLSRAPVITSKIYLLYVIPLLYTPFCPVLSRLILPFHNPYSVTEHWRISTNVLACNSFGYVVSSNNNHPQVCLSTNPINQYPPVKSCVSLWFSPVTVPIITQYTFSILSSPPRIIFSAFLRDIPCFIPSNLTLPPFRSFLHSLPSSPYPITDQGGIATPQSVNCSLVHDPPKNLKKTREPRLHTT